MKVSYNKLQTFFDQPLPKVEDLAQGIIFHAFEVEELINSGEDTILDLKVLPDRTFDCADEFGIAKEVSAIFKLPLKTEFEVVSTGGTREVTVSLQLINERLGVEVPEGVVVEILTSLNLKPQVGSEVVTCIVPATRPDIVLPENLIKEVGRIYGYDKIVVTNLPETIRVTDADNFLRIQIVRAKLVELGFTEIYGYSFAEMGDLQVLKPLQQDKPFLRTNLTDGLKEKIELNLKNILFDSELVKVFDIGSVFPSDGEEVRVVLGFGFSKAKFHQPEFLTEALAKLGVNNISPITSETTAIIEFPLDLITVDQEDLELLKNYCQPVTYKKFSAFPRITRDIALFVPEGTSPESVAEMIKSQAGNLLVRGPVLFDEFNKDGRVSLAFRLVFQSYDRTLSDVEVSMVMSRVISALEENSTFEVRK